MSEHDAPGATVRAMMGKVVVLDTRGPFVYIGTLDACDEMTFTLSEVDVHDMRQTNSSTDHYLVETRKHGLRINRRQVTVLAREVVSLSTLEDIVPY